MKSTFSPAKIGFIKRLIKQLWRITMARPRINPSFLVQKERIRKKKHSELFRAHQGREVVSTAQVELFQWNPGGFFFFFFSHASCQSNIPRNAHEMASWTKRSRKRIFALNHTAFKVICDDSLNGKMSCCSLTDDGWICLPWLNRLPTGPQLQSCSFPSQGRKVF